MKYTRKIIIFTFSILILLNLLVNPSLAVETPNIEISSPAAILMELKTGRILYDKESNKRMYPASTTKVMTALLTLEHITNLQEKATVSHNAVFSVPKGYSSDLLKVGEELSIEELLYALMIKSSNEAANVLAENIAGNVTSFASMMNTRAIELGCKDTNFVNPNGIQDENHYTSAYDLAIITKEAMKSENFRKYVSTVSHTLPSTNIYDRTDRNLVTTNDLIRKTNKNYYEYAIGIKTGFTSQAKNCLIAAASKDGIELIAVVLGADKTNEQKLSIKDSDCKMLFEYIYNNFSEKNILMKDASVKNIKVSNGTNDTRQLELVAEEDLKVLITNDKVKIAENGEIVLNEKIKAPIAKGTVLGSIKYEIDGLKYETNLVASHNVQKSSILLTLMRIILLIFILIIVARLLKPKKKKRKKHGSKYINKK